MLASLLALVMNPIPSHDWLLKGGFPARIAVSGRRAAIGNGLIERTFEQGATVGIENAMTGEQMLRATSPEARLTIDGESVDVGGLVGQPDLAYLTPAWLKAMKPNPAAFQFERLERVPISKPVPWKRVRHSQEVAWPPKGVALTLHYRPPAGKFRGIEVEVHYEVFDELPCLCKWIAVKNNGTANVRIDRFASEVVRFVEAESVVDTNPNWMVPNVTIATDYAFGGMAVNSSNRTANWLPDPDYKTQVNYDLKTPCLLEMSPPIGPAQTIEPGQTFRSFRTYELFHDSTDRERRGLQVRRMMRTLAPWCTENPLMMHVTSTDDAVVRRAIDQAAECGFEMIILSFGSGLDMEDVSPANVAKFKALRDYAQSKDLDLGGYSLLASRSVGKADDVVNPKPIFGNSPCLGSAWGQRYFANMRKFIEETGFSMLEHDGSYPGDPCASTVHPGHRGFEDSQWNQYREIADFYRWCRERGVFLNVPDNYFFAGSNKTGMGYRETNWSLPRAQQMIHARQNLFDGTWEKTPSMGWMFVPLVEYQGGGAAATIEPLKDHLADYEQHLSNCLGYGAQACYRGPRLYDSPETRAVVVKWVRWFKDHRPLLESDVVHVRRADGQNLDAIVHVNPELDERALAVVWNPTDAPLAQEIVLPLYYAGLSGSCMLSERGGTPKKVALSAQGRVRIKVSVPARGMTWFVAR